MAIVTRNTGFSADATRRIAGISYRQLDYWDKTALVRPSVQHARGRGSRRVYAFEDLVELRVVARLLAAGISLPSVRKAVRYLRENFADVSRPLARLTLVPEGKSVLIRTTDGNHLVDATAGGQVVISFAVAPIVRGVHETVAKLAAQHHVAVRVRGATYDVVLTPDLEAGGFTIEVPELPGVITEADSVGHARRMASDAIRLWLDAVRSAPPRRAAK
jgi:DNA-binding transcriptional MerR regulator/predicted RNase H-like HicB family nuclease